MLTVNYLRNQDLYGIMFKEIVNQYIVVENNNLKEFASKLGVQDIDKIPNKIESTKISENVNIEEIKTLVNKYLNVAIEEIPEDNYSKIEREEILLGDKTTQADGYQIKLKLKDIQSILVKVLENAKNDEKLFNLINKSNMAFEDYQNNINDALAELSGEISNEENINFANIKVYKQEKELVKISINLMLEEKETEISLNKTRKGLALQYIGRDKSNDSSNENIITITKTSNTAEQESFEVNILNKANGEEKEDYNITLNRTGTLTSDNVVFDMLMPITVKGGNINIQFKTTTNFSATPKFEEFKEGNHLVINGVAPEQLNNLFTNLGTKISEKLKDEMLVSLIGSTINDELYQSAEQAKQQTQNAIEKEKALTEEMTGNFDQMLPINSIDIQ